uniref:Uncharacterized protein n=1 Tax=Timema douglasi TaxID=61478 RepID=A0A7R8VPU7_TIMDO|nr:unnamed protein product [Timema douglasi]
MRGGGVMLVQSPTSTGGHMVYRVTLDCRKQGSLLPPLHYYDPNTYEDTVRTSFPHPPTDEISPTKHLKGMIVRTLVKRSPRPPPIISRDYAPKLSLRIAHSSFFPPFVSKYGLTDKDSVALISYRHGVCIRAFNTMVWPKRDSTHLASKDKETNADREG